MTSGVLAVNFFTGLVEAAASICPRWRLCA